MSDKEVDEMQAGHEIDILIAKKIMGCTVREGQDGWYYCGCPEIDDKPPHGDRNARRPIVGAIKEYSFDVDDAWQVIEKMESLGCWCQIRTPFGPINSKSYDGYWAGFTPHLYTGWNGRPDNWINAEALPLAICRAALKTVTGKDEENVD